MKTKAILVLCLIFMAGAAIWGKGKKDLLYFKGQTGTDYAVDLAHPEKGKAKLPIGASAVRCIAKCGDMLVGATIAEHANRTPVIFRFNIKQNKEAIIDYASFKDLGEEGKKAGHALAVGKNNTVYLGTYGKDRTGHLLEIQSMGKKIKVKSLGAVKEGEGIFTLAIAKNKNELYGILFPSNTFFTFHIKSKRKVLHDQAAFTREEKRQAKSVHINDEAALGMALGIDGRGRVYGSTGLGKLFRYNPKTKKVKRLKVQLPYSQYHVHTNRVESWALASNGMLFGGTSVDGYLFRLNPKTLTLVNLGKPVFAGNLKSMTIINNILYGLAGDQPEYTHFFTYNLKKGSFEDLGILRFTNTLINSRHMSYNISMLLHLGRGRMVFAEDDMMSSLLFHSQH
jgi:hypothetical protein